jgi:hypothetical protein
MTELGIFALAMVYPSLPETIKQKVLFSILSKAGLGISLDDLKSEMPVTSETAMPAIPPTPPFYKSAIYCRFCNEKLHELEEYEQETAEMEAKYLDEHLDKCPIFQVMEKHRK